MKKSKNAFTIIELLLVVAIIGLMFSLVNFDFSNMSSRQKGELFTNKIISKIEEARNYALVGRTINDINSGSVIPEVWKVEINSGNLDIKYCLEDCSDIDDELKRKKRTSMNVNSLDKGKIEAIRCSHSKNELKDSEPNLPIKIYFEGKEGTLECDGDTSTDEYYLRILTDRALKKHQIDFDSVNTLLESKYLQLGKVNWEKDY